MVIQKPAAKGDQLPQPDRKIPEKSSLPQIQQPNESNSKKIYKNRFHESRKATIWKILIGLLFTWIISFFHYNSQVPDLDKPIEISKKIQRVMELTLIKDIRVYTHQTKPDMGYASYVPFLKDKIIQIRTQLEYSIGFDLRKATAHFDEQRNNINIDFGQLQVLSVNILQQTISKETEGFLNSWSRQERNKALRSSVRAIKNYIADKENRNQTRIEQISQTIRKQILKDNHHFHLPSLLTTLNKAKKITKPYLDFFRPEQKKKQETKKNEQRTQDKQTTSEQSQSQILIQQYPITKYLPTWEFFSAGYDLARNKKFGQVPKK